jgi:hypothetical protein
METYTVKIEHSSWGEKYILRKGVEADSLGMAIQEGLWAIIESFGNGDQLKEAIDNSEDPIYELERVARLNGYEVVGVERDR